MKKRRFKKTFFIYATTNDEWEITSGVFILKAKDKKEARKKIYEYWNTTTDEYGHSRQLYEVEDIIEWKLGKTLTLREAVIE
jgi:hypothetical protein